MYNEQEERRLTNWAPASTYGELHDIRVQRHRDFMRTLDARIEKALEEFQKIFDESRKCFQKMHDEIAELREEARACIESSRIQIAATDKFLADHKASRTKPTFFVPIQVYKEKDCLKLKKSKAALEPENNKLQRRLQAMGYQPPTLLDQIKSILVVIIEFLVWEWKDVNKSYNPYRPFFARPKDTKEAKKNNVENDTSSETQPRLN